MRRVEAACARAGVASPVETRRSVERAEGPLGSSGARDDKNPPSPARGAWSPSSSEEPVVTPQSGPRDVVKAPQPSPRVMPSQMLRGAVEAAAEASAAAEAASDASFEDAKRRLSPPEKRKNDGVVNDSTTYVARPDPLRSILGYLDEVDRETNARTTSVGKTSSFAETTRDAHPETRNPILNGSVNGKEKEEEEEEETTTTTTIANDVVPQPASPAGALGIAAATYDTVKARMEELRSELARRDALVRKLEAELRVSYDRAAATTAVQLAEQRAANDAATQRHLDLADRLLADKATLADECAKLSEALHLCEAKHAAALEQQRASFASELKRHKQKWDAERVVWEEEKTKQVKELTIRGLEPEIQKLVRGHRAASAAAEDKFRAALEKQRVELEARREAESLELRNSLKREHHRALELEREAAGVRLRDQAAEYETQLAEQRRVASSLDASSAERYDAGRRDERRRLEKVIERLTEEAASRDAKHAELMRSQKAATEKRHAAELRALQLRLDEESATFKARVAAKARESVKAREAEITTRAEARRDAEIEAVAAKLRMETAAGRHDADEALRRRAERAELGLAVAEERVRALEKEAEEEKKKNEARAGGGEKGSPDEIASLTRAVTQAENRALEAEETVRRAEARRDVETAALESRVREAIGQKDEIIAALTRQLEDLRGLMA
jgi:5-azacytidine-induced protein 1